MSEPSRMIHSRRKRGLTAAALASGLVLSACSGGATAEDGAADLSADTTAGTTAETTGASTAETEAPAAEDDGSVESALLQGQFETLSGETIDLGSLQGQDVVFWFWAPW